MSELKIDKAKIALVLNKNQDIEEVLVYYGEDYIDDVSRIKAGHVDLGTEDDYQIVLIDGLVV